MVTQAVEERKARRSRRSQAAAEDGPPDGISAVEAGAQAPVTGAMLAPGSPSPSFDDAAKMFVDYPARYRSYSPATVQA